MTSSANCWKRHKMFTYDISGPCVKSADSWAKTSWECSLKVGILASVEKSSHWCIGVLEPCHRLVKILSLKLWSWQLGQNSHRCERQLSNRLLFISSFSVFWVEYMCMTDIVRWGYIKSYWLFTHSTELFTGDVVFITTIFFLSQDVI